MSSEGLSEWGQRFELKRWLKVREEWEQTYTNLLRGSRRRRRRLEFLLMATAKRWGRRSGEEGEAVGLKWNMGFETKTHFFVLWLTRPVSSFLQARLICATRFIFALLTHLKIRKPDFRQGKKWIAMGSKLVWPSRARKIVRNYDPVREPDYTGSKCGWVEAKKLNWADYMCLKNTRCPLPPLNPNSTSS
jgi:hypothetical protein